MPIDPSKALGAELGGGEASWTPDDVILYHLGVGAGDPPGDIARDLASLSGAPDVSEQQTLKTVWDTLADWSAAGLLLPAFRDEGKSHLSIGFGCTGGQHRSVAVTERLSASLAAAGWRVSIRHRELERRGLAGPVAAPRDAGDVSETGPA